MKTSKKIALLATSILVMLSIFAVLSRLSFTSQDSNSAQSPKCEESESLFDCLSLWGVSNINDLQPVLDTLTRYTIEHPTFFVDGCHETWHDVGNAAGEIYSLEEALSGWAYSCNGGYLHGVMQKAAPLIGVEKFSKDAPNFCKTYQNRPAVVYYDCWHGVGHGFAELLSFPESMYACSPVAKTPEEYSWCTWGAADFIPEKFGADSDFKEKITPELPTLCEDLKEGVEACFRMITPLLYLSGWDFGKIYNLCSTYTGELRKWCAFGSGQVLGTLWVGGLIENVEGCSIHEDMSIPCAEGAGKYVGRASEWTEGYGPEIAPICVNFKDVAKEACDNSYKYIRDLEVSPSENRDITSNW